MDGILEVSKRIAQELDVDLAIPNCSGSGIGNALMYTRLVEEFAISVGRPVSIFTGPLNPSIGTVSNENPYCIWSNNPYVSKILPVSGETQTHLEEVNKERKSLVQLNHIAENICWAYGLRARSIRPSLFLTKDEQQWGLRALEGTKRPVICIHPGGNTKSSPNSPWHQKNWIKLIDEMKSLAGLVQIGRPEFGDVDLGLFNPGVKLRETMSIIWASDIFIGFDSSPMHMATAFQKPVITIFDMRRKLEAESTYSALHVPSVMLRWSYPFNQNVAVMENDLKNQSLLMVLQMIKTQISVLSNKF